MEYSPCREANSQEIVRLLWKPKFHYLVQKRPLLVSVLFQMHPVHILPTYWPHIRYLARYGDL
jgi:hypothetical protein